MFNFNGEVFECDTQLCEKNMCKGTVLKRHLENYGKSRNREIQIVYVGDGRNDFCPGLVLTEKDFYFVKKKKTVFLIFSILSLKLFIRKNTIPIFNV